MRWPKGPPHLALKPPYLFWFVFFVSVLFWFRNTTISSILELPFFLDSLLTCLLLYLSPVVLPSDFLCEAASNRHVPQHQGGNAGEAGN